MTAAMTTAQLIVVIATVLALAGIWLNDLLNVRESVAARRELRRHNRTQRADRALKKQEAREFDEWSERALEREQRRMEREERRAA